jgi:hypothetical protein
LIIIFEARINIKIKETPKITVIKTIPKVLRVVHTETMEVFLRKEVIPKTFNNIALRDTRSITDQGIGPRTT